MRIDSALLERIVAHARRDFPNECCGMVGVRDQHAVVIHEATNVAASPLRFEVEGREILRAQDAFEDEGAELGAIYHSHTRSEPYPSQTDINFAAGWPGVEWLIVGVPPRRRADGALLPHRRRRGHGGRGRRRGAQ